MKNKTSNLELNKTLANKVLGFDNILKNLNNFPDSPGCYLMKDKQGKIFYIGKANCLKKRLRDYFTGKDDRLFVSFLQNILYEIDTIIVNNEKEALILEDVLIKKHKPKYNILLKDDKRFLILKLAKPNKNSKALKNKKYPKLQLVRKQDDKNSQFFGPFTSAAHIRQVLHLINKYFTLRTCTDRVINQRKTPCLQYQLKRCNAPCVYNLPDYHEELTKVAKLLNGDIRGLKKFIADKMWQESKNENYEQAALLRNKLTTLKQVLKDQVVNLLNDSLTRDIFASIKKDDYFSIARIIIKNGKIIAKEQYNFNQQPFPQQEILITFLQQLYGKIAKKNLPQTIMLHWPDNDKNRPKTLDLADISLKLIYPQRGANLKLVKLALANAQYSLDNSIKKSNDYITTAKKLQKTLRLNKIPLSIECFDISIIQGSDAVAAKICFENGENKKDLYRLYNMNNIAGMDDFAMLHEAVKRRLQDGINNANFPDLILIDGGKGQLNASLKAYRELNLRPSINCPAIAAIAKARTLSQKSSIDNYRSYERLFIAGKSEPINLLPNTAERYLVEKIRNEAHRFAISAHKNKRSKRIFSSQLQQIPRIGPKKRLQLIKSLGSLQNIKQASIEDLSKVPGIGKKLAIAIKNYLS